MTTNLYIFHLDHLLLVLSFYDHQPYTVVKNYLFLALASWFFYAPTQAQSLATPQELYCLWESVPLQVAAGKSAARITAIQFGERVRFRGKKQYVANESRTYLQVETVEGKIGWVNEYLLVPGTGLGVVLTASQVYQRPRTITTITTTQFEPGDLVVVEAINGDWISLSSAKKTKRGWIEGVQKVSTFESDLMLASLLGQIDMEKDKDRQQRQWQELYQMAQNNESPLAGVIGQRLKQNGIAASTPISPAPTASPLDDRPRYASGTQTSRFVSVPSNSKEEAIVPAAFSTERFQDPQTGRWQTEVKEKGSLHFLPQSRNIQHIFVAAHKTLPIGTLIRIAIPDNTGFVELEITERLSAKNPNIIGLNPACVQAIYGDYVPASVTINYLKP